MSNEDWSDREIDDGGRGEKAVDREIERLKSIYRQHAEALSKLAASAPTKALSRKYSDLIGDINRSILGLEDPGALALRRTHDEPLPPPGTPPGATSGRAPSDRSASDTRLRTEPGRLAVDTDTDQGAVGRIILILGMAIVVIGLLAFFVWRSARTPDEVPPAPAVSTANTAPEEPGLSTTPESAVRVTPEAQDFGVVYKGTRVAKPFEISNTSDRDVTIEVERSRCRCLWFDYPPVVPQGGKVELTVAVDGALAEPGLLSEGVVISTKEHPRETTEVLVTAEIR